MSLSDMSTDSNGELMKLERSVSSNHHDSERLVNGQSPPSEHTSHEAQDKEYFKSYSGLEIHRDMIGDLTRTFAYRRALWCNYHGLANKVLMDVGAGTGILSIFSVQAGAKKVYAVEASDIADIAQLIVKDNSLEDRVSVIKSRAEDAILPEPVDGIVSEWMGYMLLYECMLSSVIDARDRWLKPGGLMYPERASLFIAPISDYQEIDGRVGFWRKVHDIFNINMKSAENIARTEMDKTLLVKAIDVTFLQGPYSCVLDLDLYTVRKQDIKHFKERFTSTCYGRNQVHGFALWFSVQFPGGFMLSTSPADETTHWQQTLIFVQPVQVEQGSLIEGTLSVTQNEEFHRTLDIELEFTVDGEQHRKQKYKFDDQVS